MPTVRLDLLKNINIPLPHPTCDDRDCIEMNCQGNRLSVVPHDPVGDDRVKWFYHYTKSDVQWDIVHGKNDRRPCAEMYRVSFKVPAGDLLKLLLAHIAEGRQLLTLENASPPKSLFVSIGGNQFKYVLNVISICCHY